MTPVEPAGDEEPSAALTYRVLIVEDNLVFRHHLAESLQAVADIEVIGAVGRVAQAIAYAAQRPDLVLLDLGLPDGSGLEVITAMRAASATCKILVITVFEDRTTVLKTLKAGADGYVLKDMAPDHLINYVRSTLAGVTPISARATRHLLKLVEDDDPTPQDRPGETPPESQHSPLRPREKELLEHIAKGLSQKEAARHMAISPHTVAEYIQNIYRKLSVRSRGEAVFEALQHNLIDMPFPDRGAVT